MTISFDLTPAQEQKLRNRAQQEGIQPADLLQRILDQVLAEEPENPSEVAPIEPGSAKGLILYMAPDFNAPLEEFGDYT